MEGQPLVRKTKQIIIDGNNIGENPANIWRGLGFVSGNNSSRLLMDYKTNFPEVYDEILKLLFQQGYGAGLSHLKLEMGSDVNSSSGTEPCTKRYSDVKANVHRGAGFQLACDAKKINPNLTLDLLRWGEPHWVTEAFRKGGIEGGYEARYKWFRETLQSAYDTFGLEFDYISPDANEPEKADTNWIIWFSEKLKKEKNPPYDFSKIKIVASDEVGSRTIASEMMRNKRLRNAVDVIGLHYTTYGDINTLQLHDEFHKEIWYSEGIAPCNIPWLSCRADGNGMTGRNGALDVANRIINSFPHGQMVMYEFQPAVSAYYDGSCYAPKQLITANEPWSGNYRIDIGLWVSAHFTKFARAGWRIIPDSCFGDGEEDHAIWNTTHNYMSMISPDKKHLTMIFSNDSNIPRSYFVIVKNLPELSDTVYTVETSGNNDPYGFDDNWFMANQRTKLRRMDGEAGFTVVVKPYSIVTATTMEIDYIRGDEAFTKEIPESKRLLFPYVDDFDYPTKKMENRGNAPLYTTDQGGAFEVVRSKKGCFLEQKITKDILPTNWRFRGTPNPITCLGDDKWSNYQAIIEAVFDSDSPSNYVGVGIRYNSAVTCPETSESGLCLRLYADGKWELRYMNDVLKDGIVKDFQYDMPHKIGIGAIDTLVLCFADGHSLYETKLDDIPLIRSGRVSLCSAYYQNRFANLTIQPIDIPLPMQLYCYREDCMSPMVRYLKDEVQGTWKLNGMASYQFYNRTCAESSAGAMMEIRFYGCGIHLLGVAKELDAVIWIDGQLYSSSYQVTESRYREAFFSLEHIHLGWHTLRLGVRHGQLFFDCFEIPTNDVWAEYDTEHFPPDPKGETESFGQKKGINLRNATVPLAGAAAAGAAIAFGVGKLGKIIKRKMNR